MSFSSKIYQSKEALSASVKTWKEEGLKIVFTNGCFDLLHLGHLQYLEEASSLGDVLIIGINSDASVSKLKGKHRPINDEQTRLAMLASLYFTDAIIVFDEETPYNLIKTIVPDVLVKGGDWSINQIIGSDVVIENGGEVFSLSFVDGYSTTNIENKIIESYKEKLNEK